VDQRIVTIQKGLAGRRSDEPLLRATEELGTMCEREKLRVVTVSHSWRNPALVTVVAVLEAVE
jgi:hypothetical protein